ncbi:hypothetical protein [Flavobacterium sp. NRK1]|uniref:hypothetical protein n=1 Tax=Flavobacterium sp. NRK1 TaxID=2954929 RepID=UPI0020925561|nr:hypothetical protein [Flavobacterium sp. NRK1]MCO6149590.1 hypothetical protein [Flavobacterium sp. NRK1]
MEKINILYIGRHPEILETVVRLINNNENWSGYGAGSDEEAISFFKKINFDLVLLGCGIPKESEDILTNTFLTHSPKCRIIQHYGGGSGLLSNEILSALNKTYV